MSIEENRKEMKQKKDVRFYGFFFLFFFPKKRSLKMYNILDDLFEY